MNKDSKDKTINIINLFGDVEEAFYQLGLKDSLKAKMASDHIRNLASTPWQSINSIANKTIENLFDRLLYRDQSFDKLLHAYASGSGLGHKEFLHALLVPEICAFLSRWLPKISPLQFGCSSLYCLDDNGKPIHTRILDFPLKGTYDENERIIRSCYKNRLKVINFSTVGLPFSGLSSMNEQGLTLAIHQKFTQTFNQHGTPIFYLAHELIHNCSNVQDALDFLKKSQSITCWGFNIMDASGKVLEADLNGSSLKYNLHDLHVDGAIYTCNELVDKSIDQRDLYPQSIFHYNESRKRNAHKVLKKINKKPLSTIIKESSSPILGSDLSPITLSSMACISFSPKSEQIYYINAKAPKIFEGELVSVSNIWSSPKQEIKKLRVKKANLAIKQGHQYMAMAQTHFDQGDLHQSYHYLQMAIEAYDDEFNKNLACFYFCVLQYISESHTIALKQVQQDLQASYKLLPKYLQDVCIVIDQRISILSRSSRLLNKELNFKILEQRLNKESTYNKVAHSALKKLTFIHMDIIDVIFA